MTLYSRDSSIDITIPHGKFNFASYAQAARVMTTSLHNMSDWNVLDRLTLKDNLGRRVWAPAPVIADSKGVSFKRKKAANSARSRNPPEVKVVLQPPAAPVCRHSRVSRYSLAGLPSLPQTVLPPWVVKRP